MIIYKATNLVNGKVYIGQTIKKLKQRIKSHYDSHKKPQNIFHKALKKYGFKNFNWCIIDFANSQGELDCKEEFWIDYYKSYVGFENCNGYNSTTGGSTNYLFSEKSKTKMSLSQKKWIEENGHTRGMLNKSHSKETIELMKKIHSRGNNGNAKSIVKLDEFGNYIETFECIADASESLQKEFDKSFDAIPHISSCCKNKLRTAYGYVWMYEGEYLKNGAKKAKKSKSEKEVIQLTMSGDFIKEFNSIKEASEKIGVLARSLSRCLGGSRNSCKGYKWVYKKDYKG